MAKPNKNEVEIDVESVINDLERKMGRLRVIYDQYFLGIEKRPPLTLQKEVVRLVRVLERVQIRQTSLKFRYRSLVQKFQSYRSYWMRTTREIENGTYRRHKQRDKKRIERRERQRIAEEQQNGSVVEIDMEMIPELDLDSLEMQEWLQGDAAPQSGGGVYAPGSVEARVTVEPVAATAPAAPQPSQPSLAGQSAAAFLEQLGVSQPKPSAAPKAKPNVPDGLRGMNRDDLEARENRLRAIKRRLGVDGGGGRSRPTTGSTPAVSPSGSTARPPTGGGRTLSRPGVRTSAGGRTLSRPNQPISRGSTSGLARPGNITPGKPTARTGTLSRPSNPTRGATPPRPGGKPPRPSGTSPRPGNTPAARASSPANRTIQRSSAARRPRAGGGGEDLNNAGLNETKLKGIYQSLVDAKKRCNESTAKLSYDSVVRSIAKQTKAVKKKHNANKVDFQVVIKNGKAFLKPVPK